MLRSPRALVGLVGAVGLAAALLVALSLRRPDGAGTPGGPGSPGTGAEAAPAAPPHPVVDELRAAREPKDYRRAAARLQAACRTDPAAVRALAALLLDPKADPKAREVAAFVLGSLDAPEAVAALLQALAAAGDPAWIRTLVLALGSARDKGRDYAFDLDDGPNVHAGLSGIGVEIRRVIGDAAVRAALEARLAHADPEVRRAALRSLEATLLAGADAPDVREGFLNSLRDDADESLRAVAARALSEWLTRVPAETAERDRVAGQVVRKSLEPGEDQLRFRALPGLREGALPRAELDLLYDQALRGDREARLWALEIAVGKVEGQRQALLYSTALSDSDDKVRETAVRLLGRGTLDAETSRLARMALADRAWPVRCEAARTLAKAAADPETLRALEEAARSDPNADVRARAEAALRALGRR